MGREGGNHLLSDWSWDLLHKREFMPGAIDLTTTKPWLLCQFAFCCCDKTLTKWNLREKSISLIYRLEPIKGSQGRNSRQRPWKNTSYWLVSHGSFSLLFYKTQNHLSVGATVHSEMGPPTSIINWEYAPTDLPTGRCDGGIFSTDVPSSQMILDGWQNKTKGKAEWQLFLVYKLMIRPLCAMIKEKVLL